MAISLTYTFTPSTRIKSAEVNANFSLLASRALDKTGDTMTGGLVLTTLILGGTLSASVTADQNNYAPSGSTTASVWNLTPTADRIITGLAAGATGRILLISNASDTFQLTLADGSGSSSAANQFRCPFATDSIIDPGGSAILFYNGAKWCVLVSA